MSVTPEHEALHRIFAEDKAVFASAMSRVLKVDMPVPADMTPLSIDMTEFIPVVERRSDTVLRIQAGAGKPEDDFILIVESQTEKDDSRHFSWPYYVAYLQAKYQLQVVMVVVCSKAATAEWADKGIRIGLPGLVCQVTTPIVFGPHNVPAVVTAEDAALDLHFAVFSALTHSRGPEARVILEALAAALETADKGIASDLSEFTEAGLGSTPGFQIWRALMASGTFSYVSETRAKGRVEGRAEEAVKIILHILKRRGIDVDDEARRRIEGCTDLDVLEAWADRAFDIDGIGQLFEG
jgi:hypothetical protein